MKKRFGLFFCLIMGASIVLVTLSSNNEAFAVSGCCKARKSESSPWRRTSNDLPSCKNLNQKNDQDNVFKKTGKVWWDMSC